MSATPNLAARADPDRGAGLYYASSTTSRWDYQDASFSIHDPVGIMDDEAAGPMTMELNGNGSPLGR
jgi:hypothetical protein